MAQKLTYDEVIEACRKAWNDGTLLLRAVVDKKVDGDVACLYAQERNDIIYRCAIGVALSDEIIGNILESNANGCSVSNLASDCYIDVPPHDLARMSSLQSAHDKALAGAPYFLPYFKALIGV